MTTMKTLTINQPWAWAILFAGKDIENRNWNTHYRGPLLIHAGKSKFTKFSLPRGVKPKDEDLVYSAILGVVELVDVVEKSRSRWFEGAFGWALQNARPFGSPVPCTGKLGLWYPSPAVMKLVTKQLS